MFEKQKFFYNKLIEIAENITAATRFFNEGVKSFEDGNQRQFAEKMKEFEHRGDKHTQEMIHQLNTIYMTPIERVDILEVTAKLDDIVDGIEAAAARFEIFNMETVDEYILEFAANIAASVENIEQAMRLLKKKKLLDVRLLTVHINELEN